MDHSLQFIRQSSYKLMSWKNGLGQTAEIDRYPADSETYLWRLSQARVQNDCEFSLFLGFERWLMVWQGAGLYLNEVKLEPLVPLRFSGDKQISCRLISDPVTDLGLIYDRTKARAEMRLIEGTAALPEFSSDVGVHYVFDLLSGDTLKMDHACELEIKKSLLVSVQKI